MIVYKFSTQYNTEQFRWSPLLPPDKIIAQMLSVRGEWVVNQAIILYISLITV